MNSEESRQERAKTARRRLVGRIVQTALDDEGLTQVKAAQQWTGISRSTLNRLIAGSPNVKTTVFREVEIRLNLPRRLLRLVADGNVDAIRALPDLDPVLGTWVLRELDAIADPPETSRNANNG